MKTQTLYKLSINFSACPSEFILKIIDSVLISKFCFIKAVMQGHHSIKISVNKCKQDSVNISYNLGSGLFYLLKGNPGFN